MSEQREQIEKQPDISLPELQGEGLIFVHGQPCVLMRDVLIRVEARPDFDGGGDFLREVRARVEELTPFSVVRGEFTADGVVCLNLRPTTLAMAAEDSKKRPARFIEDAATLAFIEVLNQGSNSSLVKWVKEFVAELTLPDDDVNKAKVIYYALLGEVRKNEAQIQKLLLPFLSSLPPTEGIRFQDYELVCQHLALLLAFCFACAGIPARSTRIYEQTNFSFWRGPRGLLVVRERDGKIRGVDPLAGVVVEDVNEYVHVWTEALINGRLVPFDLTLDVDYKGKPRFCGGLPPVKISQFPGMIYHVYPVRVPMVRPFKIIIEK